MTLLELLELMRRHLRLVIALPLACAVAVALYSYLLMPDEYTASTSMYVLSSQSESAALNADLSASQMLANDVAKLLASDVITNQAAQNMGLANLDDYDISVDSSTTSRMLTLSVTGTNPQNTAQVANEMAAGVSAVAQSVMGVDSVNIIDVATAPEEPSGPSRPLYTAVGLMAGLFLAIAIVVLMDMLNTRVRSAEDVTAILGDDVAVIGRIPVMKGGLQNGR